MAAGEKVGATLKLATTSGRPLPVTPGTLPKPKGPEIPHSTFDKIRTKLNISAKKTETAATILRHDGFKVQPNLRVEMFKKNHLLDEFFGPKQMTFLENDQPVRVSKGKKVQRPVVKEVVVANDVYEVQDVIKYKRGVAQNARVRVKYGMDGGQGSLKLCMSVITEKPEFSSPHKKKPRTPKALDDFKEDGVKKVVILAIGFEVKESYENMKTFMDELKIGFDEEATFAVDLKMLNIMLGLQGHSSKHPCPWCEGSQPWTTPAKLRTLGNIRENQKRYAKSGLDRDHLMKFMNCEFPPLIEGPGKKLILEVFPPMALHLYMGGTNHIKRGLHAKLTEFDKRFRKPKWAEAFKEWCEEKNIVGVRYWNQDLKGPKAIKLLENSKELTEWLPNKDLKQFGICLQMLWEVKKSCFGLELNEGWDDRIQEFDKQFDKLGISKSNKVHAIVTHVPDFIRMTGEPLGRYSEQAMESVHQDWEKTWVDYKRGEIAESFHEQLFKCVVKYNSSHL